ncbi:MAG TPA: hypothetical protein VK466_10420 [Terriglobales bacterium]|nr:hypothetical protein [Terriglobales bacterium]
MWLLFLAVASFLAYIGILALLCLADTLETRTRRARPHIRRVEPFSTLNIAQAFEPIYATLWEAPILALDNLRSAAPGGLPASRLHPIFREAAARFPEVYDGYNFQQWLQFLENNELIDWDGQLVSLTRKGREFLAYRFTTEAFARA